MNVLSACACVKTGGIQMGDEADTDIPELMLHLSPGYILSSFQVIRGKS